MLGPKLGTPSVSIESEYFLGPCVVGLANSTGGVISEREVLPSKGLAAEGPVPVST